MKIVFDAQIFKIQRYGGISRYICELALRAGRTPGVSARIIAPEHKNEYLRQLPFGSRVGWSAERWRSFGRLSGLASHLVMRGATHTIRPDILHETYYTTSPWAAPSKTARILTIHDMIHERVAGPQESVDPTIRAKRLAAERADHIICVSEATRQDVISILGTAAEKLSVIHLAASLHPPKEITLDTAEPYLLYVGYRRGYKNFMGFVSAVAASPILRGMQIVCFGGDPFTPAEFSEIESHGLRTDRVLWRHGGDDTLANLYAGALCFVYPSLLEGFGIPPLEAMLCECPVACSNTSCIPEVVRDAGAYFDPASLDSMRQTLECLVTSPTRRNELRARGRDLVRQYSWDRCTTETLAAYRRTGAGSQWNV
jgi:glycosyltransferase involved in cell wall biosynthesis